MGQRRRRDKQKEDTMIFVEDTEKDEHENWCVGKNSAPLVRSLSRGANSENQKITELEMAKVCSSFVVRGLFCTFETTNCMEECDGQTLTSSLHFNV